MFTYPPPVALPPTSNTLSSQQRAALVRSSRKLSKVLGDVPRVPDGVPCASACPELTRTTTAASLSDAGADGTSTWSRRKPTHLPPLLKLSTGPIDDPESPVLVSPALYHRPPTHRGSVLSIAPSIVSNVPSVASISSENSSSDASQRRIKLERLRRRLGDDVPATAVFPAAAPRTTVASATPVPSTSKSTSRGRTRSFARLPGQADDAHSVAFSINSDESVHRVAFTTTRVRHGSPRPHKTKHLYQTGPLPPIPPLPAHGSKSSSRHNDDDVSGLIRPRQKMAAGSKIGGADFKAARRAKRAGHGTAELGELVEMVGFLR